MLIYVTTCLLQQYALQQLECTWWFLLHDVFTGELEPSSGGSIWCVSLTRPTQPLRAGGITCLSSTDRGRWRDHYAGLEGKSRAVMREYINMCENTLNTLNLGLDFAVWKLTEVLSRIGPGVVSVLPSEIELMRMLWHIQIWAEFLCTPLPHSTPPVGGWIWLVLRFIYQDALEILLYLYRRYRIYVSSGQRGNFRQNSLTITPSSK